MLFGTICTATFGLLQSFSTNYLTFVSLEFLVAAGTACLFQSMLILSLEWANAKNRNVVMQLLQIPQYAAAILSGSVAAYTHDFRLYMRFLYIPTLISIILIGFVPESFRWLLAKQKRDRVTKMITMVTHMNKNQISPKTEEIINRKLDNGIDAEAPQSSSSKEPKNDQQSLRALLSCRILLIRFIVCLICWITVAYVNQGNAIMSVFLRGNKYTNFNLTMVAGFPSTIISIVLLKYVGRCKCLMIFLLIVSMSNVLANSLSTEYYQYSLVLFLIARCFSLLAHLTLYLQGVELWPTPLRQTLVGLCSMAGRFGSTLSPLVPLLVGVLNLICI